MQATADAMATAWERYTPERYPGRLVLIRAELRDHHPSTIDDDPVLGWGPFVGDGIELRRMPCTHVDMVQTRHAPVLAAILTDYLPEGTLSPGGEPTRPMPTAETTGGTSGSAAKSRRSETVGTG